MLSTKLVDNYATTSVKILYFAEIVKELVKIVNEERFNSIVKLSTELIAEGNSELKLKYFAEIVTELVKNVNEERFNSIVKLSTELIQINDGYEKL